MLVPAPERFPRSVIFKWMVMGFAGGAVNAGGFMACKRFVTHVTGFGTSFGMEAAQSHYLSAVDMLIVPICYLMGAMFGAFFTDAAISRGARPRFRLVTGVAAGLLVATALCGHFDVYGRFGSTFAMEDDYLLVVLLCLASGMQNVAGTAASRGLLRSTHLTGPTTDLGLGLVRAFFGARSPAARARERYHSCLRFGSILSFIAGAFVGAVSFIQVQYLGFLLPAALVVIAGCFGARGLGGALRKTATLPALTTPGPAAATDSAAEAGSL